MELLEALPVPYVDTVSRHLVDALGVGVLEQVGDPLLELAAGLTGKGEVAMGDPAVLDLELEVLAAQLELKALGTAEPC